MRSGAVRPTEVMTGRTWRQIVSALRIAADALNPPGSYQLATAISTSFVTVPALLILVHRSDAAHGGIR